MSGKFALHATFMTIPVSSRYAQGPDWLPEICSRTLSAGRCSTRPVNQFSYGLDVDRLGHMVIHAGLP